MGARVQSDALAASNHGAREIFAGEDGHQDHRCDMNADERQQAIGNRLMKILVGLPRVDLDAGPQHRAGCNEHGQNSERPQRIVPDRALWMTRHKFPDVGQKA